MTNPAHLTRDDAHTARIERMEQLQKQHPDTDLQIESGWWKPATDFAFDVKVGAKLSWTASLRV